MQVYYVPKHTIQAALGSIFLDNAKKHSATELYHMGDQILTLAVLSILITAPLGAVAILAAGPILLDRRETAESDVKNNIL